MNKKIILSILTGIATLSSSYAADKDSLFGISAKLSTPVIISELKLSNSIGKFKNGKFWIHVKDGSVLESKAVNQQGIDEFFRQLDFDMGCVLTFDVWALDESSSTTNLGQVSEFSGFISNGLEFTTHYFNEKVDIAYTVTVTQSGSPSYSTDHCCLA